jgi:dTDP-glucose 4,6-dehydratase
MISYVIIKFASGKAKDILGFEPKYDLEDGLKKTVEWYRGVLND